jgi:hypothetical protein
MLNIIATWLQRLVCSWTGHDFNPHEAPVDRRQQWRCSRCGMMEWRPEMAVVEEVEQMML